MLPFFVDLRDGEPVSDQVVRAARRALVTGELRAGDLFPSVRQIAQDLRISPTTAQKVIHQLKDLGLLASRPGVGTVVAIPEPPSVEERMGLLEGACTALLAEAADLQLTLDQTLEAVRRVADTAEASRVPDISTNREKGLT